MDRLRLVRVGREPETSGRYTTMYIQTNDQSERAKTNHYSLRFNSSEWPTMPVTRGAAVDVIPRLTFRAASR